MGLIDRENKQIKAINETVSVLKGKQKTLKNKRFEIVLDQDIYNQLSEKAKSLGLKNATYVKMLINKDLRK